MHKPSNNISRRAFLAGATATGALTAIGLTGCAPKASHAAVAEAAVAEASDAPSWLGSAPSIKDEDCAETIDCEVLVIGAGTSGYFAAASAAESGCRVLLIEKGSSGSSVRSSALGAVNSHLQQAAGANINVADIVTDMDHYGNGNVDATLVRMWAEKSGEAIDWYADLMNANDMEVQLEWNMPEGTAYREWPTGHGTNGEYPSREQDVAEILDTYITSFDGCEERFLTRMKSLIVKNGRVVGAYAENGGKMIRVNASKGVVVGTGGYARNEEMYASLQPSRLSCLGTFDAFPTYTGDGIKAMLWAGAQMEEFHTSLTFNRCLLREDQSMDDPYHQGDYGYFFYSSQPFLRVNSKGERFHDESAPYDYVMNALTHNAKDDRYWHQVWDGNWADDVYRFHTTGCSTLAYRDGADHDAMETWRDDVAAEIEDKVEDGFIVKANTLDELADALGFSDDAKNTFLETCARQNENFDKQNDPDFGKEAFRLCALRTAPFYATVKSCALTLATIDGVIVNHKMQPIDAKGDVIEGLYAIGNDQGGFYAGTYPNLAAGINAGRCATFGRMVGKQLAAK